MAKESERVRVMKEKFMTHWAQGMGVYEVAEHYDLAPTTVYHYLQEIADKNGVTRESLLKQPHTLTPKQYAVEEKRTRICVEEMRKDFQEADSILGRIISKLDDFLKEEEACRSSW